MSNLMTFTEAIIELLDGNTIRRLEWDDKKEKAYIKDGFLMIFRKGKEARWTLHEADMIATDWIVVDV